jgi:hypothetical protein
MIMHEEMGKNMQGSGHGLVNALSDIFLIGMRKTTKNRSQVSRVLDEIRIQHLQNTSLERYRYAILPCEHINCSNNHIMTSRFFISFPLINSD